METNKVVVYENVPKVSDTVSALNNHGIQRLQHDVGETNRDVKSAEANIRHDVLFEGQESQKTSLEVEARLKDRLSIDRNAWDLQFQNLGNRISDNEKEIIKQGYEARIESLKNTERITDKVAHILEELSEEIESCCCEQKLATATNTGLLNQLVKSLIK